MGRVWLPTILPNRGEEYESPWSSAIVPDIGIWRLGGRTAARLMASCDTVRLMVLWGETEVEGWKLGETGACPDGRWGRRRLDMDMLSVSASCPGLAVDTTGSLGLVASGVGAAVVLAVPVGVQAS